MHPFSPIGKYHFLIESAFRAMQNLDRITKRAEYFVCVLKDLTKNVVKLLKRYKKTGRQTRDNIFGNSLGQNRI